jgi:aryl-alcohol dehydrogenase-like predicted oxidoreductase
MRIQQLGRSGLKVSELCIGTMLFGGATSETEANQILEEAADQGVNFIDTADSYAGGKSEEMVGRLISDCRNEWVLATKFANPLGSGPNGGGTNRKWVMKACEDSLKRLGTDHIDIYYLHKEDHTTPLEETVRAIADLQRDGKIRYFGLSNYRSWRVAEVCRISDSLNIDRPIISQPYYNLVNRMPETEQLPACNHFGLGVFPYSPIARGVLTGKYKPGADPDAGSRAARGDKRMMETEWRQESLHVAAKMAERAIAVGVTPGQFATAWVLNNSLITGLVAGPRTIDQWRDYAGATSYRFTEEDETFCNSLVAPGHPSTPGFNDPAYPIEGRVPRV